MGSLEKEVLGKTEAHIPTQREHAPIEMHEAHQVQSMGLARMTVNPSGGQEVGFPSRSFATVVAPVPTVSPADATKRSIFRREVVRRDLSSPTIGSLLNEQLSN